MKVRTDLLHAALAFAFAVGTLLTGATTAFAAPAPVKNVIVMVPDGCSQSIQTLSRWYKQHVLEDDEPLTLDGMVSGMVQTYMANSVITGSAAAATAFATGYKTTVRFLGVAPDPNKTDKGNLTGFDDPINNPYQPLATVLEGARLAGKSTGLVSTSRITHATPAAYACHIEDRGCDDEIMEHMVYQNIDVVFGGGKRHLLPAGLDGGVRVDGDNLLQVLKDRGYQWAEDTDQLNALGNGPAWGLFDDSHMDPDMDRDPETQPSLAEMTAKAIELLSQNEDGFFLMVEGSQVDWAGHANDVIYMVTDFLAFDRAVAKAVAFAQGEGAGETVVLVFPDHNTGALSIGSETAYTSYTDTSVEDLVVPLATMKYTSNVAADEIEDLAGDAPVHWKDVRDGISAIWGIDVSKADSKEILNMVDDGQSLSYALSEVVSRYYTVLGWTTHGHSGEDVPLWSYVPDGAERPVGLFDNTELAVLTADALNVDLSAVQDALFVEVTPDAVSSVNPDDNPQITLGECTLNVGTNVVASGPISTLPGVVVQAPSGCVGLVEPPSYYVPQSAVAACAP